MEADIEFTNLEEFTAAFGSAVKELVVQSEQSLIPLGQDIAGRWRSKVGGLGRFIDVTVGHTDAGMYVDIGPSKQGFGLLFQEFGTRFQPPHPAARPAIAEAVAAWRP